MRYRRFHMNQGVQDSRPLSVVWNVLTELEFESVVLRDE